MTNIEKVAEQLEEILDMADVDSPKTAREALVGLHNAMLSERDVWKRLDKALPILNEFLQTHTAALQAELDNLEEQYKSLHERHCELLERSIETTKALLEANKRIKDLEATILNEMTQIAQERG